MNANHELDKLKCRLVYMAMSAPDFPAEDKTCLKEQFERVSAALSQLLDARLSPARRTWLQMAQRELADSAEDFKLLQDSEGRRHLHRAGDYVRDALNQRPVSIGFVSGPDGSCFPRTT